MKQVVRKPKYRHDCADCVFMGSHGEFDVYVCVDKRKDHVLSKQLDSLIARGGSDPSDYFSMPRGVFSTFVADMILKGEYLQASSIAILNCAYVPK